MTDEQRHAFDNLILLCPNHHKLIDRLEAEAHTAERLREMRDRHHQSCDGSRWASEEQLDMYASLALSGELRRRPFLVLEQHGSQVGLTNRGDAPAYRLGLDRPGPQEDGWLTGSNPTPDVLGPGEGWIVGLAMGQFMQGAGPFRLGFSWSDQSGESYHEVAEIRKMWPPDEVVR